VYCWVLVGEELAVYKGVGRLTLDRVGIRSLSLSFSLEMDYTQSADTKIVSSLGSIQIPYYGQ
jgi:hypothetical protein